MKNETPRLKENLLGYKTDALYYKKCLKEMLEDAKKVWNATQDDTVVHSLMRGQAFLNMTHISEILEFEHTPPGVDLDKPNYGMF